MSLGKIALVILGTAVLVFVCTLAFGLVALQVSGCFTSC